MRIVCSAEAAAPAFADETASTAARVARARAARDSRSLTKKLHGTGGAAKVRTTATGPNVARQVSRLPRGRGDTDGRVIIVAVEFVVRNAG
jgi:hypothetical protein